jgi:predicted glycoside hydrolase/deacetylase ChbG (UPF0249 family)
MLNEEPAIRLVVNADGLGADAAVAAGVLRAHRDGIVTSTSVLGNCADLTAVRSVLAEAPQLGVGAHLTLVGGAPVSNPGAVRSLVGPDGRFPARPSELFLLWAQGALRADDVQRELDAQAARLCDAGLRIDHLDTRFHIGFLPVVGRAVETVARRHGIPGIRMAMEQPTLAWIVETPRGLMAAALGGLGWWTRRKLGALRHGPQTWGYVESGRLDEVRILEIIGRLGPGSHELICHPAEATTARSAERAASHAASDGWADPARELRALTSPIVRHALAVRGVALCRWADLF